MKFVCLLSLVCLASAKPTLFYDDPMINEGMFQGDIAGIAGVEPGHELEKQAVPGARYRWPNGVVAYDISSLTSMQQQTVHSAMRDISSKTCVKFVQRTTERNYIKVVSNLSGCWSYVGMIGGAQTVSLQAFGCMYTGTAIHEIMHALGFYHEHTRTDRDSYIKIHWQNIDQSMYSQFAIPNSVINAGAGYNYYSIMHYDGKAFSSNGGITIEPLDPSVHLLATHQQYSMQPSDATQINTIYNCQIG